MEEKQFINYAKSTLKDVVVHHVGNPKEDECLFLSQGSLADRDENLTMLLQKFFLSGFKTPEYYNFTFSNGDLSLNPVCSFAKAVFKSTVRILVQYRKTSFLGYSTSKYQGR